MREHWSLDPGIRYLNHGSFGAVPIVTQEAHRRLQIEAEANPMRWFRELPARLVTTRATIGRFLGVAGEDLALVANATTGCNVALRAAVRAPGQRLVVTTHTYGAIRLAAEQVARDTGGSVVTVDVPLDADDDSILSCFEQALQQPAGCLVVDQIASATAKRLPVERIAALGREVGVPVIVDGAHAPGLIDDPVVGDYWTGNLHKWPCAPRGTGVLYVDRSRQGTIRPPVVSWSDPLGFPLSFDLQGTTDATGWLASPTALDLMRSLGLAERRKDLGLLVEAGADLIAAAVNGRVVDAVRPAPTMRLVELPAGLVFDDLSGLRLSAYIAAETGVELAVTAWNGRGFIRLSAHLYNDLADYPDAAERLARVFASRPVLDAVVAPPR